MYVKTVRLTAVEPIKRRRAAIQAFCTVFFSVFGEKNVGSVHISVFLSNQMAKREPQTYKKDQHPCHSLNFCARVIVYQKYTQNKTKQSITFKNTKQLIILFFKFRIYPFKYKKLSSIMRACCFGKPETQENDAEAQVPLQTLQTVPENGGSTTQNKDRQKKVARRRTSILLNPIQTNKTNKIRNSSNVSLHSARNSHGNIIFKPDTINRMSLNDKLEAGEFGELNTNNIPNLIDNTSLFRSDTKRTVSTIADLRFSPTKSMQSEKIFSSSNSPATYEKHKKALISVGSYENPSNWSEYDVLNWLRFIEFPQLRNNTNKVAYI